MILYRKMINKSKALHSGYLLIESYFLLNHTGEDNVV